MSLPTKYYLVHETHSSFVCHPLNAQPQILPAVPSLPYRSHPFAIGTVAD